MGARKKVILVLLEGITDQNTLMYQIENFIEDSDKVESQPAVIRFDITNCVSWNGRIIKNIDHTNLMSELHTIVTKALKENKINDKKYLDRIILVSDIDGVFIEDEKVIEKADLPVDTEYSTDGILCTNRDFIIDRNNRKKINLKELWSKKEIFGIPFNCFYWSCNMEHVLYNKINCSDKEKDAFSRHQIPLNEFISDINDSSVIYSSDYKISWTMLERENTIIPRKTNINVLFDLLEIYK